ncbi:MAG: nucleotidyltransferase [Acidobacteriia bacterium]|nr:nucleotidyltransferase [Terriglobia bacterium]
MEINSNFKDLLRLLNDVGVRYLVVGGYAVMKYTEPYSTKDLDIWIEPTLENALDALRRFGAPAANVTGDDLVNPDLIYQVGVEPVRLDVMSAVSGLAFPEAWANRAEAHLDAVNAPILSLDDLIAAKQAAGRRKDRMQVRQLLGAKARRATRPRNP